MTYGPLAYLLKNRIYRGEIGHKGNWYPGEHAAIIDPALFDAVQALLANNTVNRRQQRTQTQSLLGGLIFDDRGNAMSPSFTTKRGVRYRFYVSSAVLSGRREQAGSLTRASAPDLESSIVAALRERFDQAADVSDQIFIGSHIQRILLTKTIVQISLKADAAAGNVIELARSLASTRARLEIGNCQPHREPVPNMVHALARAHFWRKALCDGTYRSVEELAANVQWHPKVVRKLLRLAFLAPDITEAIILGRQPPNLRVDALQNVKDLTWDTQRSSLGFFPRSVAVI